MLYLLFVVYRNTAGLLGYTWTENHNSIECTSQLYHFPSFEMSFSVWVVSVAYLLHPSSGGVEAISADIQVSAQQVIAWSGLKIKLPSGLQMTSHLSKAITARDHGLTIPGMTETYHLKPFSNQFTDRKTCSNGVNK